MQETLMEKDVTLAKRKEKVDRLEREMKQLSQQIKKAKGQERAMEVVSKQNASLLQLLQAAVLRFEFSTGKLLSLFTYHMSLIGSYQYVKNV